MNRFARIALVAGLVCTLAMVLDVCDRPAAAESGYSVSLHYGDQKPLGEESSEALYSKALEVLASSNFNSRAPLWNWSISEIQQKYRETVAGKYLLVGFKQPRKLKTAGGEVSVREIVIGLNHPQYADALFTVDDEGRIVGHAKYSGLLCTDLMKLVNRVAGDAPR